MSSDGGLPQGVVELVAGSVYALGGNLQVTGRTSWVASGVRGAQRSNCYLLLGDGDAVLIDTCPAILCDLVVEQISALLPPGQELSIFLTRAEFEAAGNLVAVAAAVPVKAVYTGGVDNPFDGFDLVTSSRQRGEIRIRRVASGDSILLGPQRSLEVVTPSLRVLAAYWAYDTYSKTLFPSDAFGYTVASSDITPEQAWDNLVSRYWWLPGAQTAEVIRSLEAVFASREIRMIAPIHGSILQGKEMVERHYGLLLDLLERAPSRSAGM